MKPKFLRSVLNDTVQRMLVIAKHPHMEEEYVYSCHSSPALRAWQPLCCAMCGSAHILRRGTCVGVSRCRQLALEFMVRLAERAGSMARKCRLIVEQAVPLALQLMTSVDEDATWNNQVRAVTCATHDAQRWLTHTSWIGVVVRWCRRMTRLEACTRTTTMKWLAPVSSRSIAWRRSWVAPSWCVVLRVPSHHVVVLTPAAVLVT